MHDLGIRVKTIKHIELSYCEKNSLAQYIVATNYYGSVRGGGGGGGGRKERGGRRGREGEGGEGGKGREEREGRGGRGR